MLVTGKAKRLEVTAKGERWFAETLGIQTNGCAPVAMVWRAAVSTGPSVVITLPVLRAQQSCASVVKLGWITPAGGRAIGLSQPGV
jgi:hypothetical protein